MSTGVLESLTFKGGEDLFFICGGGIEDMVVGGRQRRGVRLSRFSLFNEPVEFVGDNGYAVVTFPKLGHVPFQPSRS